MHGVPDQVTCTYQYYYYHYYYYCCCCCRHFPFHKYMKRKQAVIRWVASPPLNPVSFEPNTLLLLFCFFVTILFPHKSRIFCRAKLTEIITNCCQLEDRHMCFEDYASIQSQSQPGLMTFIVRRSRFSVLETKWKDPAATSS